MAAIATWSGYLFRATAGWMSSRPCSELPYGVQIALRAVLIGQFGASRLGSLLRTFLTTTDIAGLSARIAANLAVDYWGGDIARRCRDHIGRARLCVGDSLEVLRGRA